MAKVTVLAARGLTSGPAECELVHDFGGGRGIVELDGIYPLVDRVDAQTWELSGEPARDNEKAILQSFVNGVENSTTVTTPDGEVTTFNHEGGSAKR